MWRVFPKFLPINARAGGKNAKNPQRFAKLFKSAQKKSLDNDYNLWYTIRVEREGRDSF